MLETPWLGLQAGNLLHTLVVPFQKLLVCLFVIILHSPPKGGAQLSYYKPADH
jgi:hypothetical protein